MKTIALDNGTSIDVEDSLENCFLGLTWNGLKVVRQCGITYALTRCCDASSKGSMSTVVCRKCYSDDIDWETCIPDPVVKIRRV